MTCRQQLGLATINLQTKFEVSNYTQFETGFEDSKKKQMSGFLTKLE